MQNEDVCLSQCCLNPDSFPEWIVYSYTFWLCNAASATVGEPCNSLGLVAHRPEWCCVGFSVMGQNGPSCGTQTINTLLWSALHISYPHKQHHTTWHTRHPHAHMCKHTNSFSRFYSLAHENTHNFTNDSRRRRSMPKWSAADRVLPHGGIKHYRWELWRVCKHADRDTGRWRDKRQREGCREEKGKVRAVLESNCKKEAQRERTNTNEEEGVKLTCPAAGGACPPSPVVGLAGLC